MFAVLRGDGGVVGFGVGGGEKVRVGEKVDDGVERVVEEEVVDVERVIELVIEDVEGVRLELVLGDVDSDVGLLVANVVV